MARREHMDDTIAAMRLASDSPDSESIARRLSLDANDPDFDVEQRAAHMAAQSIAAQRLAELTSG